MRRALKKSPPAGNCGVGVRLLVNGELKSSKIYQVVLFSDTTGITPLSRHRSYTLVNGVRGEFHTINKDERTLPSGFLVVLACLFDHGPKFIATVSLEAGQVLGDAEFPDLFPEGSHVELDDDWTR